MHNLIIKTFKIKKVFISLLICCLFSFNIIYKPYCNPKITVFLPIYNKEKYLYRSIGSIQNQTLKNIEIIPVNDGSEDHTLDTLKKISQNDKRIKIVNNHKNRGLLYSRAMGIINSRGEYLMNLDPDDELKDSYVLEFLYNIINQTKVEVLKFGLIIIGKRNSRKLSFCSDFDKIKYQPEIFNYGSSKKDYLITNKLIKKELFIKVMNIFKEKIYGSKWNYGEDEIWSGLILKNANSMICVNKIIFIYYRNADSLMSNRFNIFYMKNLINWIEMFRIIYDKKKYKKFLFFCFSRLVNLIISKKNIYKEIKNDKETKEKYIKIFKNMIVNDKYKNKKLMKLLNSLEFS